jgi:hypothetical protein
MKNETASDAINDEMLSEGFAFITCVLTGCWGWGTTQLWFMKSLHKLWVQSEKVWRYSKDLGKRAYYLTGPLAELEQALIQWTILLCHKQKSKCPFLCIIYQMSVPPIIYLFSWSWPRASITSPCMILAKSERSEPMRAYIGKRVKRALACAHKEASKASPCVRDGKPSAGARIRGAKRPEILVNLNSEGNS